MMKLPQKLAEARKSAGRTQVQMAQKLGVTVRTVRSYEAGNQLHCIPHRIVLDYVHYCPDLRISDFSEVRERNETEN